MSRIMDPILPVLSVLGCWAMILEVQVAPCKSDLCCKAWSLRSAMFPWSPSSGQLSGFHGAQKGHTRP